MNSRKENLLDWTNIPNPDSKVLPRALLIAIIVEFALLTFFGVQSHWLAHPPKNTDDTKFIEAEVFQAPKISTFKRLNPSRPLSTKPY